MYDNEKYLNAVRDKIISLVKKYKDITESDINYIIEHSKQVAKMAIVIVNYQPELRNRINMDDLIKACYVHDLYKLSQTKTNEYHNHAAYNFLITCKDDDPLRINNEQALLAINYHSNKEMHDLENPYLMVLKEADMLSKADTYQLMAYVVRKIKFSGREQAVIRIDKLIKSFLAYQPDTEYFKKNKSVVINKFRKFKSIIEVGND